MQTIQSHLPAGPPVQAGTRKRIGAGIALALALLSGPVHAGGYDTGETNWDLLFLDNRLSFEIGAARIMPDRMLRGITGGLGPSADTPEADAFSLTSLRFGMRVSDSLRCMGGTHEPYAGYAQYDPTWTYAASAVRQDFSARSLDLACAWSVAAGSGRLSYVLGISEQEIRYVLEQDLTALNPFVGQSLTDVSGRATAWRAGLAYELPQYAMRASLIYSSGATHRPTGTVTSGLGAVPVEGVLRMPASVELAVQSGIADRTLAFGRITHSFWSQTANMDLCPVGTPACSPASSVSGLALEWRDTTRVTLGLARQVTDWMTMTGALTYDQGATQGFTSQSSVQSLTLGAVIRLSASADLNLSATYGSMAAGTVDTTELAGGVPNPVGYTGSYGRDRVSAVRATMTFRF